MAPESCPEAGEAKEEALPSPVGGEAVSGPLEPPEDTPADLVAPASLKDTKPSSTQVASPLKNQASRRVGPDRQLGCWLCRLAPESLDPHTLRLLWRQRELEIQALRSLRNQRDAQRSRILREVARLPLQRSYHNQGKPLQIQVQKLALELKQQKEQAQLEKKTLEEKLEQTKTVVQQLEAQLEALHKSCLVKLASSSWVGRMLRSSTGSVEVVTAETLLDLSDTSENDEASPAQEGFRVEDVDWNAIAHRFPNLLASMKSSSDFKEGLRGYLGPAKSPLPRLGPGALDHNLGCPAYRKETSWGQGWVREGSSRPAASEQTVACRRSSHRQTLQLPPSSPPEDSGSGLDKPEEDSGSRLSRLPKESLRKSVEWSSLPLGGISSSGSSESDTRRGMRKVTGHPPLVPGHISYEQAESRHLSSLRSSQDSRPRRESRDSRARSSTRDPQDIRTRSFMGGSQDSRPSSSLRSSIKDWKAESKDRLGPVRKARVVSDHWQLTHPWSRKGSCLKIAAVSLRERFICVLNQSVEETVDLGGFTLQQLEHDFPVYLYRFPPRTLLAPQHHVTVWGKASGSAKKPMPSSVGLGPRHVRSRRSLVTLLLSPKGELLSEHQTPHSVTPATGTLDDHTNLSIDRFPLPEAQPGADTHEQGRPPRAPRNRRAPKARARSRRRPRTRAPLPRLTPSKLFGPGEVPAPPERAETDAREPLPAIPRERAAGEEGGAPGRMGEAGPTPPSPLSHAEDGPDLADCQEGKEPKEHRVRVCRKTVDLDCPIVALSVQSMAEKRFGFRLLSCPPIPVNVCRPV
ncbi:LOW QUALITY PROTEIN: lamin tail domain-containing protein 2 [Myotis yumanensis]|uniref:LOW QUALITY PROTEIN: lamin tail domain-containing protein 2 n=1 Tax=Myotis yumanensis TaxID=159337 RepID=UPI0038D4A65C